MFPGQLLDLWEEHIVMHDTEIYTNEYMHALKLVQRLICQYKHSRIKSRLFQKRNKREIINEKGLS